MKKSLLEGTFSATPFPQVLSHIWQTEKTGSLTIRTEKDTKTYLFKKGNLVGELESFPENKLLDSLTERNLISTESVEDCRRYAASNKSFPLQSLVELSIFTAPRLWQLLEEFFKQEFFSLFDLQEAEYSFKPENILHESQILRDSLTANLIIEGIRQMRNHELITAHLPSESDILETHSPPYFNKLHLEPYEKYVFSLVEDSKSLKAISGASRIGKGETQKCIFAFLMLGVVSLHSKKEGKRQFADFSPEEFDRVVTAFNTKFTYIYKYISKKIGPVAFTTLSKCLDEVKSFLGPSFRDLELRADGSLKLRSFMKMNINVPVDDRWRSLINGLNEILAAEVLTVKRTLGNDHEAALVENLEKMGELT